MELSGKMKSKFSLRRGEWSARVKDPGRDEGGEATEWVWSWRAGQTINAESLAS